MPRRGTRHQYLRDLESNLGGDPWWIKSLPTQELRQLAANSKAKPRKVGRPRMPDPVSDIEFLMKKHSCGLLEACRRYHREASTMFLRRRPCRTEDEEAAAAALARRYYRTKNGKKN